MKKIYLRVCLLPLKISLIGGFVGVLVVVVAIVKIVGVVVVCVVLGIVIL